MTSWTPDQLERAGSAHELKLASYRPDGSLRPFVIIWAVRVGDELYVRSAFGRENGWFRRALASGSGRIQAGGVEHDVRFEEPGPEVADAVSAAYHAKYDPTEPQHVGPVVDAQAIGATLRLVHGDLPGDLPGD